jgi:nucleoside-diphosphate-sugar epimerase
MKRILITGAGGFIGSKLFQTLGRVFEKVVGTDIHVNVEHPDMMVLDLTGVDGDVDKVINELKPDVVIHCAGIAHQKIGKISRSTYFQVNSMATENLARAAGSANKDVHFIFLSSISVYGEDHNSAVISENSMCKPSSDYAESKRDAELRLQALFEEGNVKKFDILRLSPVYDATWSLNLDRRVFAPGKKAYLRFGKGEQKISAVSRQNLIDFMEYLITNTENFGEKYCNTYNVCDERPYTFNQIIETFKRSYDHPDSFVFPVPLSWVWSLTRMAGFAFKGKRKWIHSCYDKLAGDLVFDNRQMLKTGFMPKHSLQTVFLRDQG